MLCICKVSFLSTKWHINKGFNRSYDITYPPIRGIANHPISNAIGILKYYKEYPFQPLLFKSILFISVNLYGKSSIHYILFP
jgi:hypothetical protein